GSMPASASDAVSRPLPGPKLPAAPVSNSRTLSPLFTTSGCSPSDSLSVGRLAAARTALTSSGVLPRPKTFWSFGNSSAPSRTAQAESSPTLNSYASFGFGGGASATGAGAGTAASSYGASAGLEHAARTHAVSVTRNVLNAIRERSM